MTNAESASDPVLDFVRAPWPERRFEFGKPLWMLADFVERLRGLVPRVNARTLLVLLDR